MSRLLQRTPEGQALWQAGYDAALLAIAQGQHTPRDPETGQRNAAGQYAELRFLVREMVQSYQASLRRGVRLDPALIAAIHRCDQASWHTAGKIAPARTIRRGRVEISI